MTERVAHSLPFLPYSYIVGQEEVRQLLAVAYVMGSSVGGVLISGERGAAKSTIVRSFAKMMYDDLPVTLPMNATDDRVVGGWDIDSLMRGEPILKRGLLQEATDKGMLYIDEANLLDDHIVNLILDVTSTGVLVVERDGIDDLQFDVSFMLVGTMNPEEGSLRPQLLDRFGLFVPVSAEQPTEIRAEILQTILRFDTESGAAHSSWLENGKRLDTLLRNEIFAAADAVSRVAVTDETIELCARVAAEFEVVGHRAEIVMARAARAVAALTQRAETKPRDVRAIAQYAVMHRRRDAAYSDGFEWSDKDEERLDLLIPEV